MPVVYKFERTANYYETDRMDVVHHSNYIRWFEEARVEFMKAAGCPYDKMEQNGIMMPVLEVNCTYKNSVRFGETVIIHTHISKFNGFKTEVSYEVYGKDNGELKACGSSTHCFSNTSLKPVRIKNTAPEIYDKFKNALEGTDII